MCIGFITLQLQNLSVRALNINGINKPPSKGICLKLLRAMASILQNLFVRALNPESVRSLKMVMSHASLYLGIILYTAVGAKVVQLLYFYSFCCW